MLDGHFVLLRLGKQFPCDFGNAMLRSKAVFVFKHKVPQRTPAVVSVTRTEALLNTGHEVGNRKLHIRIDRLIDVLCYFFQGHLPQIDAPGSTVILAAPVRSIECTQTETYKQETLDGLEYCQSCFSRIVLCSAENNRNQRSEMADTNAVQPVDPPFFLICDNLALIREVGIIPIFCHIHQAVHIVPDFNGFQFRNCRGIRLKEIIRIIIAIVLPGNICSGILRKDMLFLKDIFR